MLPHSCLSDGGRKPFVVSQSPWSALGEFVESLNSRSEGSGIAVRDAALEKNIAQNLASGLVRRFGAPETTLTTRRT